MAQTQPDLYEGTVTRDTPHGPIVLHVPLISWKGQWRNANSGHLEPWVKTVSKMAGARAVMFDATVRATLKRLEQRERETA